MMGGLAGFFLTTTTGRTILAAASALLVVFAARAYVGSLKEEIAAQSAAKEAAQERAEEAETGLARLGEQYAANAAITTKRDDMRLEREGTIKTITREIYRDRPTPPPDCRSVLDPIDAAVDGLRRIQAAGG